MAEHQAAFQVLFGGGTRRDEEFAGYARRVEETIADAIAALIEVEGLDDADRRLLAHGIVGLAEGTSRHWLRDHAIGDPDELAGQGGRARLGRPPRRPGPLGGRAFADAHASPFSSATLSTRQPRSGKPAASAALAEATLSSSWR